MEIGLTKSQTEPMSTNAKRNRRRPTKGADPASQLPVRTCRQSDDPRPADPWESPCPDGNLQIPRLCAGYMEREPGRLQLRIDLYSNSLAAEGICDVLVKEEEQDVFVRVFICWPETDLTGEEASFGSEDAAEQEHQTGWTSCLYHIDLDAPLNGRTVRDLFTDGAPVPYRNLSEKIEREIAQQRRDESDDIPF